MLREFRERKGITQEKLSELTGIDRKTIFRIENNKTAPKINTYIKIAMALDMTDEEILENLKEYYKSIIDENIF